MELGNSFVRPHYFNVFPMKHNFPFETRFTYDWQATYWALTSMGLNTAFTSAALAEIMTKLANVAVAGVTEGAYVFLFGALGLPAAAGFTLALVKRLRSFALALLERALSR